MEGLKFVVLLFVFVQIFGTFGSPLSNEDKDGEIWTVEDWQNAIEGYAKGYPLERGMTIRLADVLKRSNAQQFHGLMGRSPGTSQYVRMGRKRHNNKGEMFIGLMGRSLRGDIEEEWKSDEGN